VKLYRNLSEAVVALLAAVFEQNGYADKIIEKTFKEHPKWGARDRRFVAEATYGIIRWFRLLGVAVNAAEGQYWKLLGAWLVYKDIEIPKWPEFEFIDAQTIKTNLGHTHPQKIRESIPDWLEELGTAELDARWGTELRALNQEAPVVLRVNMLKGDRINVQRLLQGEDVATVAPKNFPEALVLAQRQNIFKTKTFKEGLFEVQDAGSQRIAPFLRVAPGMRVIDACAGAGGKTLHLAALMQNKGRIIAMDTEGWKLEELKKRARRAGASNIETRAITGTKDIKRMANSADRLLLDAPCSGLGVLKRNPDAKWKLSEQFLEKVKDIQKKILENYAVMLKPGGLMVYATCSVLPSENERQVSFFLDSQKGAFDLVDEEHIWPSEGYDGFYMALIKKK